MEIQDTKEVWVAWTNTDCTEGRGYQVPRAVCQSKATAVRLGKKGYVQGSDCPISKTLAVKINNTWLVPGLIHTASREDKDAQKRVDDKRAALQKAKDAGLTEAELKLLGSYNFMDIESDFDPVKMRIDLQKKVELGQIKPCAYWDLLKMTWAYMDTNEKKEELLGIE